MQFIIKKCYMNEKSDTPVKNGACSVIQILKLYF